MTVHLHGPITTFLDAVLRSLGETSNCSLTLYNMKEKRGRRFSSSSMSDLSDIGMKIVLAFLSAFAEFQVTVNLRVCLIRIQ